MQAVYALAPEIVIRVALTFARVGALVMLFPLIGERVIPPRIRLALALFLAVLLSPLLEKMLPQPVRADQSLWILLLSEVLIGLIIGTLVRYVLIIGDVASQFITQALGLSLGEMLNPSLGQSTPALGSFMTLLLIVSFFAVDGHHLVLQALAQSYMAVPPRSDIAIDDFNALAIAIIVKSFQTALRLAAPFMLFGFLINLGLGLVSKLLPMVPVTFLAIPLSVMAGVYCLYHLLDPMILHLIEDLKSTLFQFMPG